MPELDEHHVAWIGQTLTDLSGRKIGSIDDIYTDDDTGQPEWLAVTAGLMGPHTYFVPMRGATVSGRGVQVPFPRDQVRSTSTSTVEGRLTRLVKGRLYAHYGCSYAEERNLLQRSLGFDPPVPSPPAQGRVVGTALALLDDDGPVAVREPGEPAGRGEESAQPEGHEVLHVPSHHTTDEPPPVARGRGQWPDDEAIFDLIQGASSLTPTPSGGPRER